MNIISNLIHLAIRYFFERQIRRCSIERSSIEMALDYTFASVNAGRNLFDDKLNIQNEGKRRAKV